MKVNAKNERIKRKFYRWLKEADGCCNATINNIEKAILIYEDYTDTQDFNRFNADKAIEFKKSLIKRQFRGNPISLTTYHTYLRYLRKFFTWLSWQQGYRRKITPDIIDYLKTTDKEERMATQVIPRNYPTLDYVVKLSDSIKGSTEIDLRDRALISFTLLSGMRDNAIITLPLKCFDETTQVIKQNPKMGVLTKFSKNICSNLFNFDDNLLSYIFEWLKLIKKKGFGLEDPIFPRSKSIQSSDNLSFEQSSEVEPQFWKSTGRIRAIFKMRSKDANLPYFPPHTYRHLAVDLALKSCTTGEQIKAVSQNFGHENIATTLYEYANYDAVKLHNIIQGIDFSGKSKTTNDKKLEQVRKILLEG